MDVLDTLEEDECCPFVFMGFIVFGFYCSGELIRVVLFKMGSHINNNNSNNNGKQILFLTEVGEHT